MCWVAVGRKLNNFGLIGKIVDNHLPIQLDEFEKDLQEDTNLNDVVIRQVCTHHEILNEAVKISSV